MPRREREKERDHHTESCLENKRPLDLFWFTLSCWILRQVISIEMMSEKLLLKWNDFKENLNTWLVCLKGDEEFSDATLACEDCRKFEAYKVILPNSSPFFHNLLRTNKHKQQLVYMRGLKSGDLCAIKDFLYCGEANVIPCHSWGTSAQRTEETKKL